MKYALSLTMALLASGLHAQQYMNVTNPREIKSLLNKENALNGFGGVDIKIGSIMSNRTLLVGGYGGVLVNHNYQLAVAAYGLATAPGFTGEFMGSQRPLNLYGGYAGLIIGATLLSKELVHLNFPVLFGAGHLQVSDPNFFITAPDSDFTIEQSAFFVVEPGLQVEFNLSRVVRLAVGTAYRWVDGLNLSNVTDADMTGWTSVVSLRFGRF